MCIYTVFQHFQHKHFWKPKPVSYLGIAELIKLTSQTPQGIANIVSQEGKESNVTLHHKQSAN